MATSTSDALLVSRCDRLGDLVLSLPALGFLRDAGFGRIWLHTSRYARPIGEWARYNGIVAGVWADEEEVPPDLATLSPTLRGLSLFHCPEAVRAFRKLWLTETMGPRTRLNAMWSYRKSIAQHRSRVEKSEMSYNVDLARAFLERCGRQIPEFRGLSALKVPESWTSPVKASDLLIVASNGGSAPNWPMSRYLERAREAIESEGKSVQFLIHGTAAPARIEEFRKSDLADRAELLPSFSKLEELVAHIASCTETLSSSTGPLHIAHAAGRPVTGLYPSQPLVQSFKRWRPDGYWHASPVKWLHL
ncbi:MAG: glycosyltransferase family 9 protein [Bdellovibrionota bacterium]